MTEAGEYAFRRGVTLVLAAEGTYSNDPDDAGGETHFGITAATLGAAKVRGIVPRETTVRDLTRDQAIAIYRHLYWIEFHCDRLPENLAIALFDGVVNQPGDEVVRMLQRALGVEEDGVLGAETEYAASWRPESTVLDLFMAERALRYCERSHPKFKRGLFRRLFSLRADLARKEAYGRVQ